jgi:hypothetical protein
MATITGKLENITGIIEDGTIDIALWGYGSQVPRSSGTGMLAKVDTAPIEVNPDGTFEEELTGNDQIAPAGTYYTVTVRDKNGDVVQTNAYVFLGSNTYDLDVTDPFDPSQPQPPLPPLIVNQLLLIPFSPTPNFPGDQYTTFGFTLTGDVTSSTLSGMVAGNLYTFIISQTGAGGWKFQWPNAVLNATPVDPGAGATTVQTFVCIANNGPLIPIGAGTYYP